MIKPTLACTAACPTCLNRRKLHKSTSIRKWLVFEQWLELFEQAGKLGTSCLTISGGEPTLYKKLPELVKAGKAMGWQVKINTNGSLLTQKLSERLLAAGVDAIDISLYSPDAALHDHMRGIPGLWQKASEAISRLVRLRKDYPNFQVISQSILTRHNYMLLDKLLEMHLELGIDGLLISYLEGDFESRFSPDGKDIHIFRSIVLPRAMELSNRLPFLTRTVLKTRLDRIFSPDILNTTKWSQGKYMPKSFRCSIPDYQALILADGNVHPCNIVEYTHKPVVGNILQSSLADIWNGRIWNDFREAEHEFCIQCPMNLHTFIPLKPSSRVSKMMMVILTRIMRNKWRTIVWEKNISRGIAGFKKNWFS